VAPKSRSRPQACSIGARAGVFLAPARLLYLVAFQYLKGGRLCPQPYSIPRPSRAQLKALPDLAVRPGILARRGLGFRMQLWAAGVRIENGVVPTAIDRSRGGWRACATGPPTVVSGGSLCDAGRNGVPPSFGDSTGRPRRPADLFFDVETGQVGDQRPTAMDRTTRGQRLRCWRWLPRARWRMRPRWPASSPRWPLLSDLKNRGQHDRGGTP